MKCWKSWCDGLAAYLIFVSIALIFVYFVNIYLCFL
jgi:hypothetical protein